MKSSCIWVSGSAVAWLMATMLLAPSAMAANFRTGDQFVVAQEGTPLKRGTNVLARFSQGQKLTVIKTEGDWLGASAVVNGETLAGWVHQRHAVTPAQYAARRTTRRSYSYQPPSQPSAPARANASPSRGNTYYRGGGGRSSSGGQFIMGLTPYGRSYWRADRKISGY